MWLNEILPMRHVDNIVHQAAVRAVDSELGLFIRQKTQTPKPRVSKAREAASPPKRGLCNYVRRKWRIFTAAAKNLHILINGVHRLIFI